MKELTEKLALESESEHQRYEMLRQQKVEAELEFSERLKSDEVPRGGHPACCVAPCAAACGLMRLGSVSAAMLEFGAGLHSWFWTPHCSYSMPVTILWTFQQWSDCTAWCNMGLVACASCVPPTRYAEP